jgi:two-component system phosphate regulon sensor histidine kinase PhoR
LYFVLVPAICIAVMLLGAAALRTTLQIERASKQSVLDATSSLAEERVDRLDKMIIAQDNAVAATVEVRELSSIAARWLATAVRETPTVRAVLVLDAETADREVRAFVSRHPGPEDDAFRRMLVARILSKLDLAEPIEQLRHLHHAFDEQSFLISYWQRVHAGHKYIVVVWHEVAKLVHEVMPQLYRDLDRNSRMNVIDEQGRILYGPPLRAGAPAVSLQFPTTLYNWRLQVALISAEGLEQQTVRQRYVQLAVVGLAMLIAVVGVVIIVQASIQERRLAALQSDFVANVSHELKTPLASVRMFAELLLTRRVPSEDKQKEYLQILVGESERLTSLIDNVLDFAKVERGKDAYEFAEGDLAEVASGAVEVLRYRAERLGIELVTDLEPAPVLLDARAIELAIINLADNALKYATGTPSVEVKVRRLPSGGAYVRVADQGPGIRADEQTRIFDRFVRGRAASDAHVRGSGIGLALVKHIADAHGGTIKVESPITEDARGSAFELSLPDKPPRRR